MVISSVVTIKQFLVVISSVVNHKTVFGDY